MSTPATSATPALDALDDDTRATLTARHAACWSNNHPDHPGIEEAARDIHRTRARARAIRVARAQAREAAAAH